jgi:RNA exonuclease 4
MRDTSLYHPLRRLVSVEREGDQPSLKRVTKAVLGKDVQEGYHCPVRVLPLRQDLGDVSGIDWEFVVLTRATVQVEDARSTMAVFMHVREQYELDLLQGKECVAGLPR